LWVQGIGFVGSRYRVCELPVVLQLQMGERTVREQDGVGRGKLQRLEHGSGT